MDFYIDLGVAVLLRIIKDRRGVKKYYEALAKVKEKLDELEDVDREFAAVIRKRAEER